MGHVVLKRVEVCYLLREEQTRYVLVPTIDTLCACLDAKRVHDTLVGLLIFRRAFRGILCLLGQHIEAEIVCFEKIIFQFLKHG